MRIAIIGSGNIGSALVAALDGKGHEIIVGSREPSGETLLKLIEGKVNISADTIANAVAAADIIIIAIPFTAIPALIPDLGDISGKIIIETSNAFGKALPVYGNGTAAIKALTGNPDVVKCFNSIGSEDLSNPLFKSLKADAFVAGESKKAKDMAAKLAKDIGFENCYDLGGDDALPLLDSLAMVWAALAYKSGLGRRCAFKVLHE